MATKIVAPEALDDALRANVTEGRKLFDQDPAPQNRMAHWRALNAFADFVLRRKPPEESQ
jgi:hypothetical protein